MHRERAHPLGHWRRADDVDEQEEAFLRARPVVTAAHDVAQAALANDLRGVAQQDQQEGHQRGNHDQQVAREAAGDLCGELRRQRRQRRACHQTRHQLPCLPKSGQGPGHGPRFACPAGRSAYVCVAQSCGFARIAGLRTDRSRELQGAQKSFPSRERCARHVVRGNELLGTWYAETSSAARGSRNRAPRHVVRGNEFLAPGSPGCPGPIGAGGVSSAEAVGRSARYLFWRSSPCCASGSARAPDS